MCYIVHNMTQKNNSTTMTVRLDKNTKDKLEKLALSQKRSKSFLATEAISEYLSIQEEQDEIVRRAMSSMDQGKGIAHQEVQKWVQSWGTDKELEMPTI